jgi:GxxExxY protein
MDEGEGGLGTGVRKGVVYPELSYQIVGALFDVSNELGSGHLEKIYQRAVAEALRKRGISFVEQVPFDIVFQETKVGVYILDFLIEGKIVLEIKQGDRFRRTNMDQVNAYLRLTGCKLALLANFTSDGVKSRRLVNLH